MHPDMWYHLNSIRHHDGCRLVHPAKWYISSMLYAIMTDADWVHPAKWDIGKFRGAFVTDADWCILSGGSFDIPFNSHLCWIPFDESHPYHHSHSFGFQISQFNSIFTFVLSFQRYTQSMYLFHILIHVLISYTHSCTRFIYSFMYSFHILIHVLIS